MELMWLCGVLLSLLAIPLFYYSSTFKKTTSGNPHLPPGKTGWPVIGESLEFLSNMKNGHLERFNFKRMARYSSEVFKTSVFGDHVAVVCGAEGNKFFISSNNKLMKRWLNRSMRMILLQDDVEVMFDRFLKPSLLSFIKAGGLRSFVGVMDSMAQHHLESHWTQGQVIKVFPAVKDYAFALACRFFMSIEDNEEVEKMSGPMEIYSLGMQSVPIDLPGTQMNRALKAAAQLKLQILQIIKHQRSIMESSSDGSDHRSFMSYFLEVHEDDEEIATGVMGMLLAGHETAGSALSIIFKFLADYPDVYRRVYQENMEVGAKKMPGELLSMEDTQKLRYTWNVAREAMRLYPPGPFLSREAMTDFTYAGYHIPKGYKLMSNIYATHKDPKYFPQPEKFDPSRFDGDGPSPYTYVPFGGGTYMCPGMTYAQLVMLVFIHNVVKKFEWKPLIPDEKIIGLPFPKPAKGLPVILHPH